MIPLQNILNGIGRKLTKASSSQSHFRARESRHKHTVENNSQRVVWWSLLEVVVIVTVGVVQVVVIRSLFRVNRKDNIRT